ncbi:hypothetical protein G6O67_000316 [Ophiocordyceps sinensis]|uniref:C2H2-type domain-containing protein n=1 Tax=Ophiocordyceps sinensis TaxID=72228 RepID=A0A8H4PYZ3_9HYPO|nr:hypothetical protein G6O67_000316 [Ophiocordyceps sinensis]
MITFIPPTDARYEPLSREHAQRLSDQQRRHQQNQGIGLSLACPRICADLDYRMPLQDSNGLNLSNETSLLALEVMQPDTWGSASRMTPKSDRPSHQRQSSLSSLGSAGPASPFAGHLSNPQIAVTDPAVDCFPDIHPHDTSGFQAGAYYQFPKPINGYLGCHNLEPAVVEKMAYPVTIPGPTPKSRAGRSLLPAPDFADLCNQSRPASVASSVAGDSPATPNAGESDHADRRRTEYCNVPKLDRTMTDVYGDELYSPNFAITSSTSQSQAQTTTSPTNDVFSQRINAANSHHLSAAHSPSSSETRTRSPFRTGSPFVSSSVSSHASLAVFNNTMRRARERAKPQQSVAPTQQQVNGVHEAEAEVDTPKTISPQDALLEFGETDGNATFPLFPQNAPSFAIKLTSKGTHGPEPNDAYMEPGNFEDTGASVTGDAGFPPTQMSSNITSPHRYPFISEDRAVRQISPRLSPSASSSIASSSNTHTNVRRPTATGAEVGTYTCTYNGCTLRFETPSLLQKHKREGHRHTQGLGGPREVSISSSVLNTQSGPHRCDRINPSTGKSCNTVFSRPYDLTRHEDTIHNARKQKVRCDMCTEEKSFSRADALTRHYRVCHPEVELPGKHRRHGIT